MLTFFNSLWHVCEESTRVRDLSQFSQSHMWTHVSRGLFLSRMRAYMWAMRVSVQCTLNTVFSVRAIFCLYWSFGYSFVPLWHSDLRSCFPSFSSSFTSFISLPLCCSRMLCIFFVHRFPSFSVRSFVSIPHTCTPFFYFRCLVGNDHCKLYTKHIYRL